MSDYGYISKKDRAVILHKTKGLCWYCGSELIIDTGIKPKRFVTDHVIPKCRGGTEQLDNLVPSCWECNSKKGDSTVDEFREFIRYGGNVIGADIYNYLDSIGISIERPKQIVFFGEGEDCNCPKSQNYNPIGAPLVQSQSLVVLREVFSRITKRKTPSHSIKKTGVQPVSRTTKKPVGIHRELSDYYCEIWEERYHKRYPFSNIDGIKTAELLNKCGGSVDDAKSIMDHYLADEGTFFNGHPLALLTSASNFPKFYARAGDEVSPYGDDVPWENPSESDFEPGGKFYQLEENIRGRTDTNNSSGQKRP